MSITPDEIRKVAEAYTEAWCSRSGEKVASFYCENATSVINKGDPTIGRSAIAEAMGAFFVEFPDLVLYMDDLRTGGNQAIYFWTLEGTNSETGNSVRIPGWQNWVLSDDLLIMEADGGYDAKEYERQVQEGV
ncbi:MAG: nuclear transport factor 2 family protein [Gammaproteobacteria bacterium]|nr:nuclear transport factor 2 family protein [Gammaproteobacteria bacterium]